METYRVSNRSKYFEAFIAVFFVLGALAFGSMLIEGEASTGETSIGFVTALFAVWLCFVGGMLYSQVRRPTNIELSIANQKIRFYNRFTSKEFNLTELETVELIQGGQDFIFKFSGSRKISITSCIDGSHMMIFTIVSNNSHVKTVSC